MIGFAHPPVLGLLVLLPVFLWLRLRQRRRDAVPFAPLELVSARGPWPSRLQLALELIVLALVVTALAGPFERRTVELIEDESADLVLVLDVSLSMLAEDIAPNRLEALRRVARDLIQRRAGDRLGLVVFAKDTFVQSPPTTDLGSLLALLDSVTPHLIDQSKSGGTAIGDALAVAVEALVGIRTEGRDQVVVLITDGANNDGLDPLLAARWAREESIRLVAIGVGGTEPMTVRFEGKLVGGDDPYLAVLDDGQLQAVADAAAGRYVRVTDVASLERVFGELSRLDRAPLAAREIEVRASLARQAGVVLLPLFAALLALGGVLVRRPFR